jgi:hypothetical protein
VDYGVVVAAEDVDDAPFFGSFAAQRLRPPLLPLGGGLISGSLATIERAWRRGCISFVSILWGEYMTFGSSSFETV